MIISHDREKLFNMMIYFVKNTKGCYKTKLFKLLYNADFLHFKETGRSISGLEYAAWEKGPVPADLFHEFKQPRDDFKKFIKIFDDGKKCQIIPQMRFDDKHFTERELRILAKVAFIFKDSATDVMVESTHLRNHPWDRTKKSKGMREKIDYELAFDDSKESLDKVTFADNIKVRQETERFFSP